MEDFLGKAHFIGGKDSAIERVMIEASRSPGVLAYTVFGLSILGLIILFIKRNGEGKKEDKPSGLL
ncbi:MAG: hypothetical protein WC243_02720 [Patescibacteria group bacterium]|jgi:hypothetical protein